MDRVNKIIQWSLIPSMQDNDWASSGFETRTKSRMLAPRVGVETDCVRFRLSVRLRNSFACLEVALRKFQSISGKLKSPQMI